MRINCIILGEALKIRDQNYEQNLPENCSKSAKIVITVCKFSKIFRRSTPPDPFELFLLLKLLEINSAGKNTLEKVTFDAPSMKKFLNTLLT